MVPEPCHGLLCDLVVLEPISIIIEDRELVLTHDIRCWLCLNLPPDVSDSSFKDDRD